MSAAHGNALSGNPDSGRPERETMPERETIMELIMRFSPVALAAAALFATVSSTSHGETPRPPANPQSVAFVDQGLIEAGAGRFENAISLYETALAIDPQNLTAYRQLAEVAMKQGLPGKAIGYYVSILTAEPNDREALEGQGRAMVQKGAVERARENLVKLRAVCKTGCPEITKLETAISAGPPQPKLAIEAVTPKPVGQEGEPSKN